MEFGPISISHTLKKVKLLVSTIHMKLKSYISKSNIKMIITISDSSSEDNSSLIKDSMVKWLILFLVLELEDLWKNYHQIWLHPKLKYLNQEIKP